MSQFHEHQVCLLLKSCPDTKTSQMSKNTALVKSLTKAFNVTLDIAKNPPKDGISLAIALAKKGLATSNVGATATNSSGWQQANFVGTQFLETVGLTTLAGKTPSQMSVQVTLIMAEKVVAAAGIANFDKCKVASASLATSLGFGAATCWTTGIFTMGIGCAVGAIAIAADAFDVYGQCYRK